MNKFLIKNVFSSILEFDSWYNETYLNSGTLAKPTHDLKYDNGVLRQYVCFMFNWTF